MSLQDRNNLPFFIENEENTSNTYNSFFNYVIQANKSYTVNHHFFDALFSIILHKRETDDIYWPILYLQWPGGKQPINDKDHYISILDSIYKQINPDYCELFNIDIRGELLAQYNIFSNNNYLSVMWNPDKILEVLKCDTLFAKEQWCKIYGSDSTDILPEPMLNTISATQQYPAYGTSCWRNTMGMFILFYFFILCKIY